MNPDALWACTSCAACMEACPVFIEQLPKIIDVRRYLVMEEGELPQTMADALTSLERRGHPFPGTSFSRLDWAEGLDIPVLSEIDEPGSVDVLLWVGCAGALLERNHATVRSLARLLQEAGVSFAILGREENCTGDPARRIGNEFLFETMARKNISLFEKYGVQQIVSACPHCFNTFKYDYAELGAGLRAEHHSTFLAR
ncbi:MAG: (Fe-S)-binding protein, partial [bacterium]|nr:(Fe-S)-binding protein [bacterium]